MTNTTTEVLATLEGDALNAALIRRTDGRGSLVVKFHDVETGESLHDAVGLGMPVLQFKAFPYHDITRAIAWTKAQLGIKEPA